VCDLKHALCAVVGFPSVGKVGPKAIGPSRFWVAGGTVPRPNEDTLKLYEAYSYLPHTFSIRKWATEEDEELKKLVLVFVKARAQPTEHLLASL